MNLLLIILSSSSPAINSAQLFTESINPSDIEAVVCHYLDKIECKNSFILKYLISLFH